MNLNCNRNQFLPFSRLLEDLKRRRLVRYKIWPLPIFSIPSLSKFRTKFRANIKNTKLLIHKRINHPISQFILQKIWEKSDQIFDFSKQKQMKLGSYWMSVCPLLNYCLPKMENEMFWKAFLTAIFSSFLFLWFLQIQISRAFRGRVNWIFYTVFHLW